MTTKAHDDMALRHIRDAGLKDGSRGWMSGELSANTISPHHGARRDRGLYHVKEWGLLGDNLVGAKALSHEATYSPDLLGSLSGEQELLFYEFGNPFL